MAAITGAFWLSQAWLAPSTLLLSSRMVLICGLFMAALLAFVVYLVQKARGLSREVVESKELMDRMFDYSADGVVTTDQKGCILRVNAQLEKTCGYAHGELIGRSIDVLVPEDMQNIHKAHRKHFYGNPASRSMGRDLDIQVRRKDGSTFPVEIALTPAHTTMGFQVMAVVQDITRRKQVEEALRRSEEFFRSVFEEGPIGIALVEPNYRIARVNATFSRMVGYSESELSHLTFGDITHPDDLNINLSLAEGLSSGKIASFKIEKRYVKKSREIAWVNMSVSTIHDREGRPAYALAMMEDITERKEDEKQLVRQAELLELAHDAIVVRDLQGRITFWNKGAADTYGWTADEAMGQFVSKLLHTDYPIPLQAIEGIVQTQGQWKGELEHTTKEGRKVVVASTWSLQRDGSGNALAMLEINRDITERKRLEAELEANKIHLIASERLSALGMMAGGIAHEINNPLGIIHAQVSDLVDLSQEAPIPPPTLAAKSTKIRQTVERISRIITSLRRIAREGTREKIVPTPISQIIEETLDVCTQRFKDCSISLIIPEAMPKAIVRCSEVQIAQVLLNVLQNAFDAVGEQEQGEKWVRIDATVLDGSITIEVTDSGPGVPPELRTHIMEPFFTTKDVGKGTGLGLSLSKAIAEEHGGSLEYCSDRPHSCFCLNLPLFEVAKCA
jgi:PAS domain S-box-containing protein